MKNDQLIPASSAVVLAMGVLASIQRTNAMPGAEFWIGLAVAYFAIAILDQVNSEIGGGFAILVMVTALMEYGEDVATLLGERTSGKVGNKPKQTTVRVPTPTVRVPQAPVLSGSVPQTR